MAKVILKEKREKSIVNHHPWLFSGAIASVEGSPQNGEVVEVYSRQKQFLGRGFYNERTSIRIRLLTFADEQIDQSFWRKRLTQAAAMRQQIIDMSSTNAYRLVHGEGDLLPGLTLDHYAGHLVLQIASLGLERQKEGLLALIQEVFAPQSIYERSDLSSRKLEGLAPSSGQLYGQTPEKVEIKENGLRFLADLCKGQKTGFFLDQRDNRSYLAKLSAGKRTLNCYCYSGAFTVYAAKGGAEDSLNIDISAEALALAEQNFKINGLTPGRHLLERAEVPDKLRKLKGEEFELVILDPPAFAKTRTSIMAAARGYKDINLQALQLLKSGGLLVTCSCSQHLERRLFQKIVHDAAIDAGRELQILANLGQAPDHPVNISHPEGEYLKCLVCRVI